MLKTIIKQENIHRGIALERPSLLVAVGSDPKLHAGSEPFANQLDFVAASVFSAIATAQNRDGLAISQEFFREPQHHRGLSRPAHSDVSNAHHGTIQALLAEYTSFVKDRLASDHQSVKQRQRPEQNPDWQRPAHLAICVDAIQLSFDCSDDSLRRTAAFFHQSARGLAHSLVSFGIAQQLDPGDTSVFRAAHLQRSLSRNKTFRDLREIFHGLAENRNLAERRRL